METNPDPINLHTDSNNLKSDKPPDETSTDFIKLAVLIKNRDKVIVNLRIVLLGNKFAKKAKETNV